MRGADFQFRCCCQAIGLTIFVATSQSFHPHYTGNVLVAHEIVLSSGHLHLLSLIRTNAHGFVDAFLLASLRHSAPFFQLFSAAVVFNLHCFKKSNRSEADPAMVRKKPMLPVHLLLCHILLFLAHPMCIPERAWVPHLLSRFTAENRCYGRIVCWLCVVRTTTECFPSHIASLFAAFDQWSESAQYDPYSRPQPISSSANHDRVSWHKGPETEGGCTIGRCFCFVVLSHIASYCHMYFAPAKSLLEGSKLSLPSSSSWVWLLLRLSQESHRIRLYFIGIHRRIYLEVDLS